MLNNHKVIRGIIMKHSIMTFLFAVSIMALPISATSVFTSLPSLESIPGTSLLPQWRVGNLPTLTGKTINDALTEHRWNYRKNFWRIVIPGTLAASLITLASYALVLKYQNYNQPINYQNQITGGIIGSLWGLVGVLFLEHLWPHGRALNQRIKPLNDLRQELPPNNLTLTRQSIQAAYQAKKQELEQERELEKAALDFLSRIKDEQQRYRAECAYLDLAPINQEYNRLWKAAQKRKEAPIRQQFGKETFHTAKKLYCIHWDTTLEESSVTPEIYAAYQALRQNPIGVSRNHQKRSELLQQYGVEAFTAAEQACAQGLPFRHWKYYRIRDAKNKILHILDQEAQASSQPQQT